MSWKRKVNHALVEFTGLRITREGPERPAEGRSRSAEGRETPAPTAPAEQVRPPADPENDRLLKAPIFIMSPVRSGSTLLRSLLNAHSMLHAPHELHVRRLTVQFGTNLAEKAMEALGHNQADLEHLLWDRVLHRELVRSGKKYLVDKTPANAFAFQRISTCWPDARYIFLLRHPASIAQSWHEASPDKRTPQEATEDALRYMRAVNKARKALPGHTVRYEDLTTDPEGQAKLICEFLGIPFEPGMLEYGRPEVLTKGLGDWKDKIASGRVQAGRDLPTADEVPEVLRSMCVSWGYLPKEETKRQSRT